MGLKKFIARDKERRKEAKNKKIKVREEINNIIGGSVWEILMRTIKKNYANSTTFTSNGLSVSPSLL